MPLDSGKNAKKSQKPSKLALVMSGGGPRGALQVGALRALMEAGIQPDMIVGTSIGAINGAYLARYGYNWEGLGKLMQVWEDAARGDLAPGDFIRATMRSLLSNWSSSTNYLEQVRQFYASHGILSDLRFGDLTDIEFYAIVTDVERMKPVIMGEDPNDLVLDSIIASSAIPPWVQPLRIGDGQMIDGGVVSDLPIEPAISHGATEIIALDLFNPGSSIRDIKGVTLFVRKLFDTMSLRHLQLELALADAMDIPVHHWHLRSPTYISLWDLSHTHELVRLGYDITRKYLDTLTLITSHPKATPPDASILELLRAQFGKWFD